MLFTSFTFVLFLTLLFILYWLILNKNHNLQNMLLLVAGYIFYGWWDWRFLILLVSLSLSNYVIGLIIQKREIQRIRKMYFYAGLIINLGVLIIFKYFNFFIEGFIKLFAIFGFQINPISLSLLMPLGISFYVFLSMSYLIDIYRKNLNAEKRLSEVLLTLSFFPIILAGPIQRPISLLPQIKNTRVFSYEKATDGLKQILWGIFMKSVIADNCGIYSDIIFKNYPDYSGSTLIAGALLFTIQIYADFAGYSNIAIGTGKLFGFNIMKNFAFPYFSRDIGEFWKRWNISLTTWFRDYVFLPIAFSLTRKIKHVRVLFLRKEHLVYIIGISITWLLTGLWHGANYTFIAWGLIQGLFLVLYHLAAKPRRTLLRKLNIKYSNIIYIFTESVFTFILVVFSWIFFKSNSLGSALSYISGVFSSTFFTLPEVRPPAPVMILIILFFVFEWLGRNREYAIQNFLSRSPIALRWAMYYGIVLLIMIYAVTSQKFIYFQF